MGKFIGGLSVYIFSSFIAVFAEPRPPALDSYPKPLIQKLVDQAANERIAVAKAKNPAARYLLNRRRWEPGATVLVAFHGGTPALHKAVADVAAEWARHANIVFDFGYDAATKRYRAWQPSDVSRAAHIRIGFSEEGYWSAIGTDSMNDEHFGPGSASMNFEGFAQQWPLLPSRWKTVVLHEFGHALGFSHEHQHGACYNEIRWSPGTNGERSVYQVFADWLEWDAPTVDFNLQPVDPRDIDLLSPIDLKSIMFYAMPWQAFKSGKKSKCFLEVENKTLSQLDIKGVMMAYPKTPSQAIELAGMSAAEFSRMMADNSSQLTDIEQRAVANRVASTIKARRPLVYIHIQREADRQLGEQLRTLNAEAGFIAPGIENVGKKGIATGKTPEVRYFREVDKESAEQVAGLLAEPLAGSEVRILHVKNLAAKVHRNLVEIWLP